MTNHEKIVRNDMKPKITIILRGKKIGFSRLFSSGIYQFCWFEIGWHDNNRWIEIYNLLI